MVYSSEVELMCLCCTLQCILYGYGEWQQWWTVTFGRVVCLSVCLSVSCG